jgi:hypothetical protein
MTFAHADACFGDAVRLTPWGQPDSAAPLTAGVDAHLFIDIEIVKNSRTVPELAGNAEGEGLMLRPVGRILVCLAVLVAGVVGAIPAAGAATVTPFPGTADIGGHSVFDLATVGYSQSEYLFEGTASAYGANAPVPNAGIFDGKWTGVTAAETAPFRSRIVVNRPIDEDDFNGTVIVEWFNVSGNRDTGPDWQHTHVELIRRGYAWVGVSAQFAGVNRMVTDPALSPRYGPAGANLVHPGDSYSYDIFSQAGELVREHADVVLGELEPEVLIAAGESQSAGRLVTYINAVQPLDEVYDGFFVHSRSANGAALRQPPLPTVTVPPGTQATLLRDDLDVPVVVFQAENDTSGVLARQNDHDGPLGRYRLYEVAGTAHFDHYGLLLAGSDTGARDSVTQWFDSMRHPTKQPIPELAPCAVDVNTGPATFVARAAITHLDRWISDGTPPPRAPRLETTSVLPVAYAQDANGNVLGGVRTPAVDAPVAQLNGMGNTGPAFCSLFGVTVPLTAAQLEQLYGSHGGFVSSWNRATRRAVGAGFVVREDGRYLQVVGAQSDILKDG